jgi:cellulose synthase/poly-beta-1,6-N-acetylglucosamine synthase-like glycosyltransferase
LFLEWIDYAILAPYLMAMVCLMVFGAHRYLLLYQFRRVSKGSLEPHVRFDSLPVVTVQLPLYNERYVARRLIDHVCALEYPVDKLEIQVLDDSDDDTRGIIAERVACWRARGLDIRHVRRPQRVGFKAGALAWGMERARGDFMMIFDADFLPPADVLRRSIHYLADPGVGMVQMRWGHINRDYSLLTRLQSIFLDGHFVIEHFVRYRLGRFFNFNGTAGIWRRRAILDAGGWSADTLTEDLDLSYRAQMAGWKFVYLPEVAAPAELPVDIGAFKNQQYRWARGSVQTARKILPRIWRCDLPWPVKVEATAHLTANFAYLFLLLPVTLALPAMIRMYHTERLEILGLYAAFFIFATLSVWVFFGVSQRALHKDWRRRLLLFPFLMSLGIGMALNNARAVLSGLVRHSGEFVRTPKFGDLLQGGRKRRAGYASRRSWTVWLETAYVFYFAWTIYYALTHEMFGALPYLLIFFFGFAYVATLTVWQAWRGSETR